MMKRLPLAALFLLAAPAYAAVSDWQQFLSTPTHDAYLSLHESIEKGAQDCNAELPTDLETLKLFALIGKGNADAFAAAIGVSQCFSAANLEHFYRASGALAQRSPGPFLAIVTAYAVSDEELPFMLTLSPPGSKEGNASPATLDARITALQSIDDAALADMQKRAVLILAKARADIPK